MHKLSIRLEQVWVLLVFCVFKLFAPLYISKYKDVWLISERGNEARDNGYAFFKYLTKNHPEIDARYVIEKQSPDLHKIEQSKIVYCGSPLHYKLFLSSEFLISSHVMGFSPNFRAFTKLSHKLEFFNVPGKKIFLQHGIIKDNITALNANNTNLDLFICGAKPEFDYISSHYGYQKGIVQYTGLARYDELKSTAGNHLLLMPTWRSEFYHLSPQAFKKTTYYQKYHALIENPELNHLLEKARLKLIFYPHPEMRKFIHLFKGGGKNVEIVKHDEQNLPELLRGCRLLITDYSSVFFDVAYLKKPVIYYHFDYAHFRQTHYHEGYFDYERDGFGPVVHDEPALLDRLEYYLAHDFSTEQTYAKRHLQTFQYSDRKNCERIYRAIKNLQEADHA